MGYQFCLPIVFRRRASRAQAALSRLHISLLHCYQFFLTKVHITNVSIFFTKEHICRSSFLLWYQVSYISMKYNFSLAFTTSSKECQVYSFNNQEGLVMTRFKELGRSGNYVLWNSTWPRLWISSFPTWRNFFKLFCLSSTKATHVWNYEMEIKRNSYRAGLELYNKKIAFTSRLMPKPQRFPRFVLCMKIIKRELMIFAGKVLWKISRSVARTMWNSLVFGETLWYWLTTVIVSFACKLTRW